MLLLVQPQPSFPSENELANPAVADNIGLFLVLYRLCVVMARWVHMHWQMCTLYVPIAGRIVLEPIMEMLFDPRFNAEDLMGVFVCNGLLAESSHHSVILPDCVFSTGWVLWATGHVSYYWNQKRCIIVVVMLFCSFPAFKWHDNKEIPDRRCSCFSGSINNYLWICPVFPELLTISHFSISFIEFTKHLQLCSWTLLIMVPLINYTFSFQR